MRQVKINIPTSTTQAELFFVEKSFELLTENTIDTYRLRLHNPKTILTELLYLIKSYYDHNIAEDYAKAACDEAKDLISLDKELRYVEIDRNYFLEILGRKELTKISYAINILLKENEDYLKILFDNILIEIARLNDKPMIYPSDLKRLNFLISFLYVELRKIGFNKIYLHRTIRAIFSANNHGDTFLERFNIIRAISSKVPETFTVYFHFIMNGDCKKYVENNPVKLNYHRYKDLVKNAAVLGNKDFTDFILASKNEFVYSCNILTLDYYSASIEARKILHKCLDFCFLGDEKHTIVTSDKCFVMGSRFPEKSKAQNLNYKLDGDIKGNYDTFKIFTKKFESVANRKIEVTSLDKLQSALRYLRLGNQDVSPEQKLIDYWIAIEYIFSSYDGSSNKTTRLKDFFKKIHGYSYTRRLFLDLHQSINNLKLEKTISGYSKKEFEYLTDDVTETELFKECDKYPLLNYRLYSLRERFKDSKSITNELKRHMNNIERNMMRIYRVRNQIIHNAASDINNDDIFELTIHLKYYLIFTINGILDFLLTHPLDINNDKGIGIDDYFSFISIKLESLLFRNDLSSPQLIRLANPVEYLKK